VKFRISIIVLPLLVLAALPFFHNHQLGSLLFSVETSEATMESHAKVYDEAPKETLMSNGSRQYCLGGVEGNECSFNIADPMNYWIRNYLNENASTTRENLLVDRYEIEKVTLFDFFPKLNSARDLYIKHVDAWVKYLENRATCGSYSECFNKTNEISPTFRIAKSAFLDSMWPTDSENLEKRINGIFED
jgi:hypothetical protein